MSNQKKQYQVHKELVLYAYCYPDQLFGMAMMYGALPVKFGMATLLPGCTLLESARNRMSHQKEKGSSGATNEAFAKIVLGAWYIQTSKIESDHVIAEMLKKEGHYDTVVLNGGGREWYLFPFDENDRHPECISIIERMLLTRAGGDTSAFESVLTDKVFSIEYDNVLCTIPEARAKFADRVSASSKLTAAFKQFQKTRGISLRTVFMKALTASKVHKNLYAKAIDQFMIGTMYKADGSTMVSDRLYSPALLPSHQNSIEFLSKVPADTTVLEVVNDPITFMSAVVLGTFTKVRFVGTEDQAKMLAVFGADAQIEIVGLKASSQIEYHKALNEYLSATPADVRILNAALSVGNKKIAGAKTMLSARKTSKVLIAGVPLDCIMNRKDPNRNQVLAAPCDIRIVNDLTHIAELSDRFIGGSCNKKEHFEAVGTLTYGVASETTISDGREALVYGPANEHSLPLPINNSISKVQSVDDICFLGMILDSGKVVDAAVKVHGGSFKSNAGRCGKLGAGDVYVQYPGKVGNPSFKKSALKSGASITLFDGRKLLVEKRFLGQTQPAEGAGLVLPSITLNPSAGDTVGVAVMPKRHAEAYLKFESSDPTVIAIHALLIQKQTTVGNILGAVVPFKNIPWSDIEIGKFDEYMAANSGLDINIIRHVTAKVLELITYYVD